MIYDCFMFYNELDLLDIRLNTHGEFVDKFIICEANYTHMGYEKPYYFLENKDRFKEFEDRITYIPLDVPQWSSNFGKHPVNPANAEVQQRDSLLYGLSDLQDDDIVIYGDCDEIINPAMSDRIKNIKLHGAIRMINYFYYLNVAAMYRNNGVFDTVGVSLVLRGKRLKEIPSFQQLRFYTHVFSDDWPLLTIIGGWHYSCLGGAEHIQSKIMQCSEQCLNQPHISDLDVITHNIKNLIHPYLGYDKFKDLCLASMPLDASDYVMNNQDKFKHLIYSRGTCPFYSDVLNTFSLLCIEQSDINLLLPEIRHYALQSSTITEFGVGRSTFALAAGFPKKMVSYDKGVLDKDTADVIKKEIDFEFISGDTRAVEIEETDLLFIDTTHNYECLSIELNKHANKVKKYILMHDTHIPINKHDVYNDSIGMWKAIDDFLEEHDEWQIIKDIEKSNGLTVLEKK